MEVLHSNHININPCLCVVIEALQILQCHSVVCHIIANRYAINAFCHSSAQIIAASFLMKQNALILLKLQYYTFQMQKQERLGKLPKK